MRIGSISFAKSTAAAERNVVPAERNVERDRQTLRLQAALQFFVVFHLDFSEFSRRDAEARRKPQLFVDVPIFGFSESRQRTEVSPMVAKLRTIRGRLPGRDRPRALGTF